MDEDYIARKKIQILYHDVLGEVTKVLDRVELLKNELPAAAEEKLARPVGELLMAAQHFEKAVVKMTDERVKSVKADITASGERAKHDALGDIRQAVREAVQLPMIDLVKDLNTAVGKARGQQRETLKMVIVAALATGIMSGIVTVAGAYFLLKPQAQATAVQVDESPAATAKLTKKGNK